MEGEGGQLEYSKTRKWSRTPGRFGLKSSITTVENGTE